MPCSLSCLFLLATHQTRATSSMAHRTPSRTESLSRSTSFARRTWRLTTASGGSPPPRRADTRLSNPDPMRDILTLHPTSSFEEGDESDPSRDPCVRNILVVARAIIQVIYMYSSKGISGLKIWLCIDAFRTYSRHTQMSESPTHRRVWTPPAHMRGACVCQPSAATLSLTWVQWTHPGSACRSSASSGAGSAGAALAPSVNSR
jgi:hypothetical protein